MLTLRIILGNFIGALGIVAAVVAVAWYFGASPETTVHMIGGALLAVAARTGFDIADMQAGQDN